MDRNLFKLNFFISIICMLLATTIFANPPPLSQQWGGNKDPYSIRYPQTWVIQKPNTYTLVLHGELNTDSYYSMLNIQKLPNKIHRGYYHNINEVIAEYQKQLFEQAKNTKIFDNKSYVYRGKQRKLFGKQYFASFNSPNNDRSYKLWQIVIPSMDGTAFYTVGYTSSAKQFDRDLPTIRSMIKSWQITK